MMDVGAGCIIYTGAMVQEQQQFSAAKLLPLTWLLLLGELRASGSDSDLLGTCA